MNIKHNLRMIKGSKLLALIFSLLVIPFFQITPALADEFIISNNGRSSSSTVNVSAPSSQTIDQTNNGAVANNTTPVADSGSNTVSGNTKGNAGVTTGAAKIAVDIKNSTNISVVKNDCCAMREGTEVKVASNGQGSHNTATVNGPKTTNVNVTQNADITNSVTGTANSGHNFASGNGGNVSIKTGKVTVTQKVVNEHINQADVSVTQGGGDVSIKIARNGESSVNTVSVTNTAINNVVVLNAATLKNVLAFNSSSGDNNADSNIGNVSITTGDVLVDTFVKNADINFSKIVFSCCNTITTTTPPPPPTSGGGGNGGNNNGGGNNNTSNTTSNSTSSSSSSTTTPGQGGGPGILGASIIMPATGSNWALWLSLLSAIMFALGLYLRFHPGQDPGIRKLSI